MAESTSTQITIRGKRVLPEFWHRSGEEIQLGCSRCPELKYCGGLSVRAPIFDCMSLCCGSPKTCTKFVCPKQRRYSTLVNEAGGFNLSPYLQRVAPMRQLPRYVPCLLDGGTLVGPVSLPTVAISLYSIIDYRTGIAKYDSREQLLSHFKIRPDAKLVIAATGEDRKVENFWHIFRSKKTAASLMKLRPALIATPNFSMHGKTVRHDNLLSMSRIVHTFETFAAAGLPVAIHVNGRTDFDFKRWTDYLASSPEIYAVAYEFGTIGRSSRRRAWHADRLIELARNVSRPLTLLVRGGKNHLSRFATAFSKVIVLDTNACMKAKFRQSASRSGAKLTWHTGGTQADEPVDELLAHNVRVSHRHTAAILRLRVRSNAQGAINS